MASSRPTACTTRAITAAHPPSTRTQHELLIHGAVQRPMLFTVDDLMRFPAVSAIHFLECSGNSPLWKPSAVKSSWTVQRTPMACWSCCEWTGVRLADVLEEVGLQPSARWMLAEGADAAGMTRSIPVAKALDDAMLAYAQNGERLRPEQGYPVRLLLPGYEGNMNVKWLHRLKFGDQPFYTREETSKYTGLLPDGSARQFVFVMEVKSVITRPPPADNPWARRASMKSAALPGRVTARSRGSTCPPMAAPLGSKPPCRRPVLSKCLTRFRPAMAVGRQPGGAAKPRRGRDRRRPANPRVADCRTRHQLGLSL